MKLFFEIIKRFLMGSLLIQMMYFIVMGPDLFELAKSDSGVLITLVISSLVFGAVGILSAVTEFYESRRLSK